MGWGEGWGRGEKSPKLNCPSDSEVLKGDRLKEKGFQCCPTLQRADSIEVISWSGRPIEREGNRLLFDPMVGHILVPQLQGRTRKWSSVEFTVVGRLL